eukprot:209293-Pelagomonas_calceolata.AAC.2
MAAIRIGWHIVTGNIGFQAGQNAPVGNHVIKIQASLIKTVLWIGWYGAPIGWTRLLVRPQKCNSYS